MKTLVWKSLMLIMVLQDVTNVLSKPTRKATTQAPTTVDRTPLIYESQLVVWPTDVDDIIEAVMPSSNESPVDTLITQPVVVMPNFDDTHLEGEEMINNFDYDDDDEDFDVVYDPNSDLWPFIIGKPEPAMPDPIITLENYHHKYNNGSEEYKLVLSNGISNYQRIDHVLVNGVLEPTQQGYYTVPSQGTRELYQTTYYRADENGYNVYKTEQSPRNPAYDVYLQYTKDQDLKLQKQKLNTFN